METDALLVEIAKLESNPKPPITPTAIQVPVLIDETQEVPKVLKANVAPIPPVPVYIPAAAAARKNLTKGMFILFISICYIIRKIDVKWVCLISNP